MPTADELRQAGELYDQREPRGVVYRACLELLELAAHGKTRISPAEALVVFLQSWNARYYVSQYHGRFPHEHFAALEELITRDDRELAEYRARPLEGLVPEDAEPVRALFAEFEALLGPVGAAKALHLLAPRFFPLWDRTIAAKSGYRIGQAGTNAPVYWQFTENTRNACVALGGEAKCGERLLKQLDELNYCRTQGWM